MQEPVITHLGMTQGEWPVHAFTSEQQAAYWAGESQNGNRYIWPVVSIEFGEPLRGVKIPASVKLEQVG
jgi:hypothetical protein